MTRTRYARHEPPPTYGSPVPAPPTPAEQLAEWSARLREARRGDPDVWVATLKAFRRAARRLGVGAGRVKEIEAEAMGGARRPGG